MFLFYGLQFFTSFRKGLIWVIGGGGGGGRGGHVAMAGKAGILFVTFFKQTFAMYLVPFSNLWVDFSSSAQSLSLCSLLKASGMSGTNGRWQSGLCVYFSVNLWEEERWCTGRVWGGHLYRQFATLLLQEQQCRAKYLEPSRIQKELKLIST